MNHARAVLPRMVWRAIPLAWLACAAGSTSQDARGAPTMTPRSEQTLRVAAESEAAQSVPEAGAPPQKDTLDSLLASLGDPSASTSIGSVTNGKLVGGVALPKQGPGFRHNERRNEQARYATAEVIRAIVRAARVVHDELPGSELVVNDLSFPEGGSIPHHGSHRAGRDADILFYMLGDDGKPTRSVGTPLDLDGIGFDFKDLSDPTDDVRVHLDPARTWRFVEALLVDPEAEVQRIFVAEHLRTMLLREAERRRAPADVVARFSDITCQPSYPHDDHLHVRWFCTPEDLKQGCQDLPPLYPWRAAALAALGLTPVIAQKTRSVDPAPVTTQAQANRAIARQKPHPSVLAFMKRRKAWEKQPHPGRPYCR